ncbi:hypothetical protein MOU_21170 [Xanthomonas citri pv. malvacearum str. GSPB1386]|nr:hypothetical protein BGK55_21670 [Xanthomonas citri pv. malvacearum]EKQ58478.1 hypothetical protein MOU_21170 [Xanthomonas citri pv. malvacearum str. GSPB1386]OOW50322.1 hypothetical protein Xcnt_15505 [Xanthomonas campestris pv. centellae]
MRQTRAGAALAGQLLFGFVYAQHLARPILGGKDAAKHSFRLQVITTSIDLFGHLPHGNAGGYLSLSICQINPSEIFIRWQTIRKFNNDPYIYSTEYVAVSRLNTIKHFGHFSCSCTIHQGSVQSGT